MRTHYAGCVRGGAPWHRSYQGVKQHLPKEDFDGAIDKVLMTQEAGVTYSKKRQPHGKMPSIKFVSGSKAINHSNTKKKAQSWDMKVDIGGRLQFSQQQH